MNNILQALENIPHDHDRCLDCGQLITEQNYSGWFVFTPDGRAQAICWACNEKRTESIFMFKETDDNEE